MVSETFIDYQVLKPLMKEIRKDDDLYLTVVSTGKHQSDCMDISYRRIEEEGFLVNEKTRIIFNDGSQFQNKSHGQFEQLEYEIFFQRLQPDMVVLFGNTHETLSAAIAASLN